MKSYYCRADKCKDVRGEGISENPVCPHGIMVQIERCSWSEDCDLCCEKYRKPGHDHWTRQKVEGVSTPCHPGPCLVGEGAV